MDGKRTEMSAWMTDEDFDRVRNAARKALKQALPVVERGQLATPGEMRQVYNPSRLEELRSVQRSTATALSNSVRFDTIAVREGIMTGLSICLVVRSVPKGLCVKQVIAGLCEAAGFIGERPMTVQVVQQQDGPQKFIIIEQIVEQPGG